MTHVSHTAALGFEPPLGLRGSHVQSILGSWALRGLMVRRRRAALLQAARPEVLDCGAGIRLLGYHSAAAGESKGLVILLHGWEGSSDSHYMISAGGGLHEAGFDVFRLNFRDHGGTHALNEELFHSCRLDEVANAVGRVVERHPARRTFLLGYSLGGNFALRIAASSPSAGLDLTEVIAICPVLRPHSTMLALEQGLWIYRDYFLRRWRRSLAAKAATFPKRYDFGDLTRFRTLTETTEFFVKRYTEFGDLDSYLDGYKITGGVLKGLSIPAWLVAAEDDPVIPVADLDAVARSPALKVTVAPYGGHCGFLENFRLGSWLDRMVLAELLGAAA